MEKVKTSGVSVTTANTYQFHFDNGQAATVTVNQQLRFLTVVAGDQFCGYGDRTRDESFNLWILRTSPTQLTGFILGNNALMLDLQATSDALRLANPKGTKEYKSSVRVFLDMLHSFGICAAHMDCEATRILKLFLDIPLEDTVHYEPTELAHFLTCVVLPTLQEQIKSNLPKPDIYLS